MPAERAVRSMIIVIVLALPQFVVEQMNVVGDAVGIQQLIKLLIVDPVRSLDLAVEMRRARADVDVADIVVGKRCQRFLCGRCFWLAGSRLSPCCLRTRWTVERAIAV